jgi:hypothetical protein
MRKLLAGFGEAILRVLPLGKLTSVPQGPFLLPRLKLLLWLVEIIIA